MAHRRLRAWRAVRCACGCAGDEVKPPPTPEEAIAIVMKQREKRRESGLKYSRKPESKAKQREYMRKLREGYELAKKAGLIE